MNEASPIRPSACPGLYRLAPARDGGICRVKLPMGTLDAGQARVVAAVARRYGNGVIEITSRSNLQLRGVASGEATALADTLYAAGLGAATAAADDVRNVMVSPSYGIDASARMDVTALATSILSRLETRSDFHALSPKFSLLVDGGESTAPLDHPNDITLTAIDGDRLALGLAGTLAQPPLGWLPLDSALLAITTIIERFLAAANADAGITRIRHLGAAAPLLAEGLLQPISLWQRPQALPSYLGAHGEANSDRSWIGARPPLGRLDPDRLAGLAALAESAGNGTVRFTPFQSLILPGVAEPNATLRRLEELGFVTAMSHPLAGMLACSGSTGCRSALADTQRDGLTLAGFGVGEGLHVSGCEKSCASARPAPLTLVAVAPGRYDLYRRAEDAGSRFGEKLASGLTVAAAARKLAKA